MRLKDILEILDGTVICGAERLNEHVEACFASDLLSDVLTVQAGNLVLLTGMTNVQTIRTAEMADIICIILVRKKKAPHDFIQLANENNQVVIECAYSMFKSCGLLGVGLKAVY